MRYHVGLDAGRLKLVQRGGGRWELHASLQHPEASIATKGDASSARAAAGCADLTAAAIAAALGFEQPTPLCRLHTVGAEPLPFYGADTLLDVFIQMRAYEKGSLNGRVIREADYSPLALEFAQRNLPDYKDDGCMSLAGMALSHWGTCVRWAAAALNSKYWVVVADARVDLFFRVDLYYQVVCPSTERTCVYV